MTDVYYEKPGWEAFICAANYFGLGKVETCPTRRATLNRLSNAFSYASEKVLKRETSTARFIWRPTGEELTWDGMHYTLYKKGYHILLYSTSWQSEYHVNASWKAYINFSEGFSIDSRKHWSPTPQEALDDLADKLPSVQKMLSHILVSPTLPKTRQ